MIGAHGRASKMILPHPNLNPQSNPHPNPKPSPLSLALTLTLTLTLTVTTIVPIVEWDVLSCLAYAFLFSLSNYLGGTWSFQGSVVCQAKTTMHNWVCSAHTSTEEIDQ